MPTIISPVKATCILLRTSYHVNLKSRLISYMLKQNIDVQMMFRNLPNISCFWNDSRINSVSQNTKFFLYTSSWRRHRRSSKQLQVPSWRGEMGLKSQEAGSSSTNHLWQNQLEAVLNSMRGTPAIWGSCFDGWQRTLELVQSCLWILLKVIYFLMKVEGLKILFTPEERDASMPEVSQTSNLLNKACKAITKFQG